MRWIARKQIQMIIYIVTNNLTLNELSSTKQNFIRCLKFKTGL